MNLENYELDHLDIEQNNEISGNTADRLKGQPHESIILDELSKQVEELQDKLQLSYRKLFLFETENQKITKDKNFYFYEKSNLEERLKIAESKIENLGSYSNELEQELNTTTEKMNAFDNLCKTQLKDLSRLTKFYTKIQNVIKPYIQNLKNELTNQQKENEKLIKLNSQSADLTEALTENQNELKEKLNKQTLQFEFEKKNLILSYEEQIHFLSREIIDFQQKITFAESECLRLKKSNETKNFIENELVRFKRTQAEDQSIISELRLKQNAIENINAALKQSIVQTDSTNNMLVAELDNLKDNLNLTRVQFSKKIEENEHLELRLKMLERLNSHLSTATTNLNLSSSNTYGITAQNYEEPRTTL